MNPQCPKLYSFLKLHKDNLPIRPVVSFVTSPSYKLSKKLIDIINSKTDFTPRFSIKNSLQLVDKIKDIKIPHNSILASFDVTNLFPSIPTQETISIVEKLMTRKNIDYLTKDSILTILKTCLSQNYFQFDYKIYSSDNGLIMGDPLSPILAEIFMDYFETKIMKHPLSKNLLFWYRYVDDIIVCWKGTSRQLDNFFIYINNIHNNIKFTIELEKESQINFLDLTISRIPDSLLKFKIFRKPTYTDIIIHKKSLHPYSHKMSTFYSLLYRLLLIPLNTTDYNHELNIIRQLAVNNSYNPDLIDHLLSKIQYKLSLQTVFPTTKNSERYHQILTFVGELSNYTANTLRKYDLNIAFRTDKNLQILVKNNKDRIADDDKSGVYIKECGNRDCRMKYVGQTGRTFKIRNDDHKSAFSNNHPEKSHYAKHILETGHTFDDKYKILHVCNKGKHLDFLETMEINRLRNTRELLNCQLDLHESPLLNLYTHL